jgi:UDP-N-acetylmuramoyl-tripeptide--D-alanyl-D-alanine ligase
MTATEFARYHGTLGWIVVAACLLALVPSGARWLRVAQREHYLSGSSTRFAARWWTVTPLNAALALVALAGAVTSLWWTLAGLATAVAVAAGPIGLGLRGRSSPLAWTRRLRTLAVVWLVAQLVVVAVGIVTGLASPLAVLGVLVVPVLVDAACALTRPFESRAASRFVHQASTRLSQVAPTVVAITGSFGKTSTKNHLTHLIASDRSVVASPASFNNRAGLARAVNEHLADGTQVFVAEMGTYGPGEIADLCRWCPPEIAVITAIGPVHLERFGSEDRILEAKAEITVAASTVVLNVDDARLAALADRLAAQGKRVVRCSSSDIGSEVSVIRDAAGELTVRIWPEGAGLAAGPGPTVVVVETSSGPLGADQAGNSDRQAGDTDRCGDGGEEPPVVTEGPATRAEVSSTIAESSLTSAEGSQIVAEHLVVPAGVQPGNLACAIGVARALGLATDLIAARLSDLPAVGHRLEAGRSPAGFTILDDTYNSNPSGAREALAALVAQSAQPTQSAQSAQSAEPRDLSPSTQPRDSSPSTQPHDSATQRLVVVTPGMVELGRRQAQENEAFGAAAAMAATDLVVVGRTNRRALVAGSSVPEGATVHLVADRDEAVAWVRANLSPGDAVLYENDLPDHYP